MDLNLKEPPFLTHWSRKDHLFWSIGPEKILYTILLKLLRLISNDMDEAVKYDTIQHDFKHDEYVDLSTRDFDRITIRICDVTGK